MILIDDLLKNILCLIDKIIYPKDQSNLQLKECGHSANCVHKFMWDIYGVYETSRSITEFHFYYFCVPFQQILEIDDET